MISSLSSSLERFLSSLNRLNSRAETAQRRLTTGKELNTVSDGPDRISMLLTARAGLAMSEQAGMNLNRTKAETDTAEQALGRAVSLVERAIMLASQSANGTVSADTRLAAENEVTGILEQLVATTQVRVENRFIFSGDSDQQIQYTYDSTQPNPVSAYNGSAATRNAQHPAGTQFRVARSGQEIFDGPGAGESVFQAVDDLRTALAANAGPAIETALADLRTAHTYLNRQLAFYGSVQTRVKDAIDFASRKELLLKSQISGIEDADAAEQILEMQQAQLHFEAALSSRAQLPRRSLFDYLG
jgi:flagellin-like hook-associated protein FlgL